MLLPKNHPKYTKMCFFDHFFDIIPKLIVKKGTWLGIFQYSDFHIYYIILFI